MSDRAVIASAGNVLPAAFAALRSLGYAVSLTGNGRRWKAENNSLTLIAEDPLLLLGLAKLHEMRGNEWQPTEAQVEEYLSFDTAQSEGADDQVAVWEEQGAVHVFCVSSFGDPVELGEVEAKAFADRLNKAIGAANSE
ncbi:hypothetical protein J2W49_003544 [Hydrogenophaga palleronii]|uniref:Uncharacterized protein n=1 Tax=Hydrogenophaga palleronii TaxID=65655 RepID=A0ABU1WQJ3_9BURK|nr:hypothetical protein [Hydrogenophaga palleronii]MDR7151568.1 hypothetical protein [Hydrogenophaga palleronii]